jgi:hypothetical protein
MIYCVWYPAGGFGHFVNAVLTLHGVGFVKPSNSLVFSNTGDSHSLELVLPKYFHNEEYNYCLDYLNPAENYAVLIDNGINDESTKFLNTFKESKVIKICYSDYSWPIIAKTSLVKAEKVQLEKALPLEQNWDTSEDWAVREKYFLYLRDHYNRHTWRPDPSMFSLPVESLLDYNVLSQCLHDIGIDCTDFKQLHESMLTKNNEYFFSVVWAKKIIDAIKSNNHISVEHITDLWDQAVINYFVYLEFGVEVPANTYANWFVDTKEISKIL